MKLEKGISTCYRFGRVPLDVHHGHAPSSDVHHEHRPPVSEKIHVRVCGAVQVITEKMTNMVEIWSVEV